MKPTKYKLQKNIAVLLFSFLILPISLTGKLMAPTDDENPIETSLVINLPSVYVLPDSPFYQIKKYWEGIRYLLTLNVEQKTSFLFGLSEIRLAETLKLLQEQKTALAQQTLSEHRVILEKIESINSYLISNNSRKLIQNRLENQKQKLELIALLTGEYKMSWER